MRHLIPSDLSALLQGGIWRSLASLGIKLATAGLTYLTYVALSRSMAAGAYGDFAIGLSLATMLAVLAGLGQQTAILRLWPAAMVRGRKAEAVAALRAGAGLTIGAALVTGAGLGLAGLCWSALAGGPGDPGTLWAAALLILPLALAEFQSAALRAQGSLWTALVPRDLCWRGALPLAVLLLAGFGLSLSGSQALLLAALLLLACLLAQGGLAQAQHRFLAPAIRNIARYWRQNGRMSRWFLYGALIDTIALNADTLFVGLLLDPHAAGTYFNASRTAGLMTLFTYASTLVIAPMLTEHFHAGDRRRAQAVTAISAWSGFAFSLLAFGLFAAFGGTILSIFGPEYSEGRAILLILSIGLLFDAATGSSRTTMVMTDHERAYVYIAGGATLLGTLVQLAVIPLAGLVGAALVSMLVRIVTQLAIGWYCITRIGIDPTIFGPWRRFGTSAP